jgi:hypothetical protein
VQRLLLFGPALVFMKSGKLLLGCFQGSDGEGRFFFATVDNAFHTIDPNDVVRMEAATGHCRVLVKVYLTKLGARQARDDAFDVLDAGPPERCLVWHLTPRGWERGHWHLPGGKMIWYRWPADSVGQFHETDTPSAVGGWVTPERWRWFRASAPEHTVKELMNRFGEVPR